MSRKKALKKPDQNPGTLPPVIANDEKEAVVVSPTVRASESETAGKQSSTSPLSSTATIKESRVEWLTVGKGGRKNQPAGPQSRKSSQVDTNSSPSSQTYAQTTSSPKPKYPPKTPPKQTTPSKVRSFSPGQEKFEKLLEFKKQLDQEQKSTPEPAQVTLSSAKQPRIIRLPTTPPQSPMPPPSVTVLKPPKKGHTQSSLPLKSPPVKPSPSATKPATSPAATVPSPAPSPCTTLKKCQRSSSIDSLGDEVPKPRKKDKLYHHSRSNICRVDEGVLDHLNKVQPQMLKDLRVLHNFKEVNGRNVEDP